MLSNDYVLCRYLVLIVECNKREGKFFWMMNNVININIKKTMMHEMLIKQTHWEENKHILFQDHIAWKVERKQTFIWKRGETSWYKLRSFKNSQYMKMLNVIMFEESSMENLDRLFVKLQIWLRFLEKITSVKSPT